MMCPNFLNELSLTELENLSKEVKGEIENRKKAEQLVYWEKIEKAIDEYFSKGYRITFEMWDGDYTVGKADWHPNTEVGTLFFD